MDAPISLGLLIIAVVGWIRDLRVRLAEVLSERNAARVESEFWEAKFRFVQRGYDLLASMYRTATRHQRDAEPLPFDPQDWGGGRDLFRGLLDLAIVFRVRADGSAVIGGSLTLPVRTVTADATAAATDYLLLVGTRAVAVTITLHDAALHEGRQLVVKDSSGQAATWSISMDTAGGSIDGTNWLSW